MLLSVSLKTDTKYGELYYGVRNGLCLVTRGVSRCRSEEPQPGKIRVGHVLCNYDPKDVFMYVGICFKRKYPKFYEICGF